MDCSGQRILEREFFLLPNKNVTTNVVLTYNSLFFYRRTNIGLANKNECLLIRDIVGCHFLKRSGSFEGAEVDLTSASKDSENASSTCHHLTERADSSTCGFVVFAYPYRNRFFNGKKARSRQVLAFEIPSTSAESTSVAEAWRNVINCLCRDLPLNLDDIPNCVPPPRRRLLVLINPYSGQGKSCTIFRNEVAPMLFEACIPYKVIVTEYNGHASELLKTIEIAEWYGIVILSGDGLVYETINGIMQRDDWVSSIKVPIGCLPGGSGNALCCSITHASGEPFDSCLVLHSTYVLVKHSVVPLDLVALHIRDHTVFSCVSVTWGLAADIDFESESYRVLGGTRFTIGAVVRIVGLRSYSGRISFLPVAQYSPIGSDDSSEVTSTNQTVSTQSNSTMRNTPDPAYVLRRTYNTANSNYSKHQTIPIDMKIEGSSVAKTGSLTVGGYRSYVDAERGNSVAFNEKHSQNFSTSESVVQNTDAKNSPTLADHLQNPKILVTNSHMMEAQTAEYNYIDNTEKESAHGERRNEEKSTVTQVPTPFLPPLDQEVPHNWVMLDGKFITAIAVYQTHMARDVLASPNAQLCDGHILLHIVRDGISRSALLGLLISLHKGSQTDSPYLFSVKVLAFRLESASTKGNIMVDGERFEPCPMQGQIIPGLARVMAIK